MQQVGGVGCVKVLSSFGKAPADSLPPALLILKSTDSKDHCPYE